MGESRWYVITGGPSSGKTTIISKLTEIGYQTVPESSRLLIDKGMTEGKTLEEIRVNEKEFQLKVLEMKIKFENELSNDKIVFLDRGIPDTIAYFQLYGFDVQEVLETCKEKRYIKIFFLEPLAFERDYARIENEETAKKLNELIKNAYTELGYEVVSVPNMPIEERVKFIMSKL